MEYKIEKAMYKNGGTTSKCSDGDAATKLIGPARISYSLSKKPK